MDGETLGGGKFDDVEIEPVWEGALMDRRCVVLGESDTSLAVAFASVHAGIYDGIER